MECEPKSSAPFFCSHRIVRQGVSSRSLLDIKIYTVIYLCMATVFIGRIIKDELQAQRKSAVWLAGELGCNRTNVYKIFNRHSIDTELLFRISRAMHRNFFEPYTERLAQ